jgi:energy-coupling factor transporter ATP-binding protein EcfA2
MTGDTESLIVDFGLSNEFFLPLKTSSPLETDLFVTIIGALSDLAEDEVGVFQVLLQKTQNDWAQDAAQAVQYLEETGTYPKSSGALHSVKEKTRTPLFAACLRVAGKSYSEGRTWRIVKAIGAGLTSLSNPSGNELIPLSNEDYTEEDHEEMLLSRQSFREGMLLNLEELACLVHPPTAAVQSEKLQREMEQTKAAPGLALHHALVLGENHYQNETREVTLSNDQRTKHIHLIGASGSGKSTLMMNLIKQDLDSGQGLCVIDPHGDLIDSVLENMPENRIKDVVLFDPSDAEYPIGFNILQANSELEKTLLSSDLIATFRRMSTSWGDVMDSVLANAILAFVESERGGTLFDLKRFLVEKDFRNEFLKTVKDEAVRYFWLNEFPLITGKPQSSILIRLDTFLRQKLIRHIVCQKDNKIDFRRIMDERKILLVKLSQGAIGEENSHLLGTLLMSKLYQTALSRQDTNNRPFFSCYLDEFHHFITPSMESVLSGVRKYNLGLVLAHQEFRQLQSRNAEVASSVLSNCYTRICFRLGDTDAERFAAGFSFFDTNALQNLSVGEAVGRIERAEYDFNLKIDLPPKVSKEIAEQKRTMIVNKSRRRYATSKAEVETQMNFTPPAQPSAQGKTERAFIERLTFPSGGKEDSAQNQKSYVTENPVGEKMEIAPAFIAPTSLPPVVLDKDTQSHRYLQLLVKRVAESKGFLATIEKEVFGGAGKIDVALERKNVKIAVEISVTNEADYEVQNIRKGAAAGFNPVVVISADRRHLEKIRKLAAEKLTEEELLKTEFFTPEEFHAWLEAVKPEEFSETKNIKGFKVNLKVNADSQKQDSTRKKAISDIVFGGLKKLKKKLD